MVGNAKGVAERQHRCVQIAKSGNVSMSEERILGPYSAASVFRPPILKGVRCVVACARNGF